MKTKLVEPEIKLSNRQQQILCGLTTIQELTAAIESLNRSKECLCPALDSHRIHSVEEYKNARSRKHLEFLDKVLQEEAMDCIDALHNMVEAWPNNRPEGITNRVI